MAENPVKLKRKAKTNFMFKSNQFFCRQLFVNCKSGSEYRQVHYWFWCYHHYGGITGLFLSRQTALDWKIARRHQGGKGKLQILFPHYNHDPFEPTAHPGY
jgi:hypothetical protein